MPGKPQLNHNFTPSDRKTQQLTVVVRIRPALEHERDQPIITHKVDDKMVLLVDPSAGDPVDILRAKRAQDKKYVFDCAFDGFTSQADVYEKTTKGLVENVINGYNGTVFAYGATGAGKTHTMVGTDNNPGIMVRALKDLFMEVDKENKAYNVSMSYLEIYNEAIRDLLTPSPSHLDLREDAKGNHQVVGLSEMKIGSSEQVMSLLTKGNRQRTQESTGANQTSSRSHALLVVRVKKSTKSLADQRQRIRTGSLYMVDLAGSERAANTQNTGKRLVEGAHINKSLLALGNCINALAEKHVRYVNFRDSKLTRLLKEPLTGNCRTVMVAHVSPLPQHYEETRNTLVYADRAKNITTKLRSNVSDVSFHVAQYQSIISELRQEIQSLQKKINERGQSDSSSCSSVTSDESKIEKRLSDPEMKDLKGRLIESFNTQMEVRRRMMEIDNTLLGHSIEFDKLNMVLNEWETEKAVTAMDNGDTDRRSSTSADTEPDESTMPEHVRQAWEDLQYLKSQQARYLQMREDCQKDYERCKQSTHKATESLPDKKASSQEQRELLHLLARVYELEVEKMELQSSQLMRDHELRYRDLMLLRYDRQRQLCDDIITRQRQLIDAMASDGTDKNAGDARKELNELYRIYQQELQELANGRDSRLLSSSGNTNPNYRPGSSMGLRPLGTSESMWELHNIKQNTNTTEQNPLPPIKAKQNVSYFPISSETSDEDQQLFRRRKAPPSSRNSNQDSSGGRRSDASDLSIKSHISSDSPRLLPPLDKYPNDPPPRYVSDVAAQTNKNRNLENNIRNGRLSNHSSEASLISNDSRKRSFTILRPKQARRTSDGTPWTATKDQVLDLEEEYYDEESIGLSEHRHHHREFVGDPPRRFGLLPSLKHSTEPIINYQGKRKGAASSDSEVSRHNHSKPRQHKPAGTRLHYQNQATENLMLNRNVERRSKSYDRAVGYAVR